MRIVNKRNFLHFPTFCLLFVSCLHKRTHFHFNLTLPICCCSWRERVKLLVVLSFKDFPGWFSFILVSCFSLFLLAFLLVETNNKKNIKHEGFSPIFCCLKKNKTNTANSPKSSLSLFCENENWVRSFCLFKRCFLPFHAHFHFFETMTTYEFDLCENEKLFIAFHCVWCVRKSKEEAQVFVLCLLAVF